MKTRRENVISTEASVLQTDTWQKQAHRVAQGIRLRVLDHTIRNNGGYLSQACSSAELFATLYTKVMHLGPSCAPLVPQAFNDVPGPQNPRPIRGADYNGARDPQYDRFFLSPGHYALVEYATLVEVGRMAPEGLGEFNQDGSTVEMIGADHSPGFEAMSGSLAQAISIAGGIAQARKLHGEPGKVWVFMTDGEIQEGQIWEAMAAISHYKLDNIGIYIDVNGQQCDGKTECVMGVEPLKDRFEAFGAVVAKVDGNDLDALAAPAAWDHKDKPLVVLAYTNPCQGLDILQERAPSLHYVRFKSKEEQQRYEAVYQEMLQALKEEEAA
jgi:transketolase